MDAGALVASLRKMATQWEKDAAQYQTQVDEARAKGLPHAQMLSMKECYAACAKQVRKELDAHAAPAIS